MTTDRFHKAAKDGMLDVLKEATRRDCNGRDEQGMTPTLWCAFEGKLDALRLLVGRGGDPDKADYFGNTAIHLAAARGHATIVTFLVNFGANIYAMDIDEHTPQELAGMNNREDILRFLDGAKAKLEASDKKKSKAMREKAKKDWEKRIKEFNKRQAKAETISEKKREPRPSMMMTLRAKMGGSMSNLNGIGTAPARPSFSTIVHSGTMSGTRGLTGIVQKRALARQNRLGVQNQDDFKIVEVEDGKRSVRSLKGVRRDSEVMYVGTYDPQKRGRLTDGLFKNDQMGNGKLVRARSQPDILQDNGDDNMNEINGHHNNQHQEQHNNVLHHPEPASIFDRPGIGSIAFRKSITNTLNALSLAEGAIIDELSIGSAGSLADRQRARKIQPWDNIDELSDSGSDDSDGPNGPLERFLTAWGLGEYAPRFIEEKIDLDALMMLTETDLKTLGLPLGPYRKLVTAINERKSALRSPGEVTDSQL